MKILSWNVNGLKAPRKQKTIFHWIKKQKCDVVCLQEIHVKKEDSRLLVNKGLRSEFYSLSNKKTKGVVFYINKEFHPKIVFSDLEGRYIVVGIDYGEKKNTFSGDIRFQ